MVNEINKPSENVRLGERLAESNRQLLAMQEEHQRLVLEMDMLRQRATELQRRNAQQLDVNNNESMTSRAESADAAATSESTTEDSRVNIAETVEVSTSSDSDQRESNFETPSGGQELSEQQENTSERGNDDEDPEYLRDKLAEIATLKAQYRRVQNMINTTNIIEEHLKSKENPSTGVAPASATTSLTSALSSTATSNESSNSALQTETEQNNNARTSAANNEKEELLSAMMNMFTDFTSDLRSQAENLRAERDRIRALKDELLNRKNAS